VAEEGDPEVKQSIRRELELERRKLETPDNFDSGKPLVRDKDQLAAISQGQGRQANLQATLAGMTTTTANSGVPYAIVNDVVFIAVIAAFCAAAVVGIIVAIICCCRMRKSAKDSSEFDYTSYDTKAPPPSYPSSVKPPSMDRKLAQSAQMFHYQHQKQQMLEMEKAQEIAAKSDDEATSDEETADSHYTVYECPGLANTGEMEVRNPLYSESPLPPSVSPLPVSLSPQTNGPDTTTTTSTDNTAQHVVNGEH